jgi:hypothetical protein
MTARDDDLILPIDKGPGKGEGSINVSLLFRRLASAETENERLREAIADALADLEPGYAPYALLATVIGEQP